MGDIAGPDHVTVGRLDREPDDREIIHDQHGRVDVGFVHDEWNAELVAGSDVTVRVNDDVSVRDAREDLQEELAQPEVVVGSRRQVSSQPQEAAGVVGQLPECDDADLSPS